MKRLLLLLLVTLGYWSSNGQCTGDSCQGINIANGASWSNSHGTPTWGNNSVWLWSYFQNGAASGEGVNYSGFNFVQGEQYCVSFTLTATTNNGNLPANNVSMNVILTPNAVQGNVGSNVNNPIPATPNPNQVIMNQNIWNNVPNTQTFTFNFTANQNFNNIWFFPQNPNAPQPQIEVMVTNLIICDNCDPTDSPAFDMDISCDNGNKCVTVTSNDPGIPNHWWGLMEIADSSNPNDTSDANTVDADGDPTNGITPVSLITGQNPATFCWLDVSTKYYIKHGIWDPNCYEWREDRIPIPDFEAVSEFHFEDANGIAKDEFCFGEDIYLDGIASQNYDRFFIDAWRRPIGSGANVPFTHYANYGWTISNTIGTINLSQEFLNNGDDPGEIFEPGFEYQIKLAIANLPECIPWTPTLHEFTVECCDDFFDATFHSQQSTFGNIEILSFNTYSSINATHEWFVLSSPNQTGGPYTPVMNTIHNGPAPFTLTINAQPQLFYTVIHRITTLCEDVCSTNVHYFHRNSDGMLLAYKRNTENGCELIDEVFPPCEVATPINLQVIGSTLTWDPVSGATGYIVESTNFWPLGCECDQPISIVPIQTTQTSVQLPVGNRRCFVIQVRAICADGSSSQPSDWLCVGGQDGHGKDERNIQEASVTPNPTRGNMVFNITTLAEAEVTIEVYDFNGIMIKSLETQAGPERMTSLSWDGNHLKNGIYFVVFKTDVDTIVQRVVVY